MGDDIKTEKKVDSTSDPEVLLSGKIEKFDGTNYQWWRMQIEDELYDRKLHLPLEGDKPVEISEQDWKLMDRRALAIVRKSLTQAVAFNVAKQTTVRGILDALAGVYEKSSASTRLFLIKKLVYLCMPEGKSIADHLNDFNKIWAQIEAVELNFDDDVKSLLFMSSLPDSWDTAVTSISNSTKEKLKFDEVLSAILNQEMMKKSKETSGYTSSNSVLTIFDKGKEKEHERGRNRNRSKSRGPDNRGRSKSRGKFKGKVKCWICEKEGHVKKDCPERVKNNANVIQGHEENLCLSAHDNYMSDVWYIDSGASFHCTSHREWFSDFVSGEFGHVIVGNGQMCKIEGRGIIKMKVQGEGKLILYEVRYIPDLKKNLISVNKLDREGYRIIFENSQWKICRGAMVVIKGKAMGTLYPLTTKVDPVYTLTEGKDSKATLWHRRLGHLSESGMKVLHSRRVLTGISDPNFDFCEDCVLGKQRRVTFTKDGREKKTERLELVHTDVWGPVQEKSFGGNYYFITFIDDYSRKTWAYTIKEKSEVFNTFKFWKAKVENETGLKLKCLLSDNGGEYCNKNFDDYCNK